MARQIIKVEDEKKSASKKKKNVDLSKIGEVISENSDTIETIATTLLNNSTNKKTKKSKNSKTNSNVSTWVNLFSKLFKSNK